jgi:acyl-CoA reductase-like NAD-dependent aldehyde dehydrogenase
MAQSTYESLADQSFFAMTVNGRLVSGVKSAEVINPATGAPFAVCGCADSALVDVAVGAARAAALSWAKTPVSRRQEALIGIAEALSNNSERFARLLTQEQGKILQEARDEVAEAAAIFRGFASMAVRERTIRDTPSERVVQDFFPLGVVAAITAWNFPLGLFATKVAPAILAGNAVIAKPAPTTPLTTLLLTELSAEFLPPGLLNALAGGNDVGEALVLHPGVDKVTFTGSTATGRKVMEAASRSVKKITLELGGNDAAIVLDDADPKGTAQRIFDGAMLNAGQICTAIKRVYVAEPLYDSMCEELARLAEERVVGDGLDPRSQMGPIQNAAHYERVLKYQETAANDGRVIAGGTALDRPGYFVRPTIVRDIADASRLVREEQFGPVLPVLKYREVADAIRRTNDSDYGLGATVWGRDSERATEVAKQLQSGIVWVNRHLDLSVDIPCGGAKQSGIGVEFGEDGLLEFTQRRIISRAK